VCIYTLAVPLDGVYKYTVKSQDVIKALKSDGWEQVAQKGSHVQFSTQPKKAASPSRIRRKTFQLERSGASKARHL
jgi:hypothetical protein